MSDRKEPEEKRFAIGATLFVFLEDAVLVLGEEGTEALIPAEDLEAFLLELVELLLRSGSGPDSYDEPDR